MHRADNPVNHFPVFEPTAERVAAIAAANAPDSDTTHYDASKEVRAKGAAFYAFSKDEEQRRKEMEGLRIAREETEKTRREGGAVDVKVGEVEGMVASGPDDGTSNARSRAAEKRRREVEDRRKLVEAKRRKLKGERQDLEHQAPGPATPAIIPNGEKHGLNSTASDDPFSALEAKTQNAEPREKKAESSSANMADEFLAKLEHDLVSSASKHPSR